MYYWLLAMIFFVILEFFTTNLVTIWFALGALVSLILSIFIDNVTIQILVFFIVSMTSIVLTRSIVKKYLKPKIVKTNYDRVIDDVGVVIKDITSESFGEVKADGKVWTAKSNEEIKKGERVRILKIEGVKLIVKKEELK